MGESTSWRSVGPEHRDLPRLLPCVVWHVEGDGGSRCYCCSQSFAKWCLANGLACRHMSLAQGGEMDRGWRLVRARKREVIVALDGIKISGGGRRGSSIVIAVRSDSQRP